MNDKTKFHAPGIHAREIVKIHQIPIKFLILISPPFTIKYIKDHFPSKMYIYRAV